MGEFENMSDNDRAAFKANFGDDRKGKKPTMATKEEFENMSDDDRAALKANFGVDRKGKKPTMPTKLEFENMSDDDRAALKANFGDDRKGKKPTMPTKEEFENMSDDDRAALNKANFGGSRKSKKPTMPTKAKSFPKSVDEGQVAKSTRSPMDKNITGKTTSRGKKGGKNIATSNKTNKKLSKKGESSKASSKRAGLKAPKKPSWNGKFDNRADEEVLGHADDVHFMIQVSEKAVQEMRRDLSAMEARLAALMEIDDGEEEDILLLSEDIALLEAEIVAEEESLEKRKKEHEEVVSDRLLKSKARLADLKKSKDDVSLIERIERLIAKAEEEKKEREAYEMMSDEDQEVFRQQKREHKKQKRRERMQLKIAQIADPAERDIAEKKMADFEAERARIEALSPQEREAVIMQTKNGSDKLEEKDGFRIRQQTDGELDILATIESDTEIVTAELETTLSEAIADATGADLADVEILAVDETAPTNMRFLQAKKNEKIKRFGAKFAVKSDSPASSKRIEKTLLQPDFGDAVVSGWNSSSSGDSKFELGGAVTRAVETNEVHEEDNEEDYDQGSDSDSSSGAMNLAEKYKEDVESNWQLIVAACIVSALFICLLLYCCNCISCCGVASAKC